ncbi:MAG: hypothetical protein A2Y92_02690 [Chloroflexi bacterium RBG_13_57_8]|nr:MAG: hypothetical protein A2Y92_02690 [Chloroflexi bacterium RBG_13_57_8]
MSIEVRFSVMSPEAGIQKAAGGSPPGMGAAPSAMGGRRPDTGGPPPGMGFTPPAAPSFARRPGTLENKTVYLVDTGFGGSYQFMRQLQEWFRKNMPSVTTVRKRKPGSVFMDDNNSLWEEIKEKGHAAVMGVAG